MCSVCCKSTFGVCEETCGVVTDAISSDFSELFKFGTNFNTKTRLKPKSRTHNITNAAIIFPLERFFRAVELRGFFFVVVLLRLLVFDCPFAAVFLGVVFLLVFTLSSFSDIGESIKTARLNVKRHL